MKKLFIFILVVAAGFWSVSYYSKQNKTPIENMPINTGTDNAQVVSTTTSQTYNISIENFAYSQKTITINKGDTIVWKNIDRVPHDVVGTTLKELKSPIMGYGLTYSFTFNEVGTYEYFCSLHPKMIANVIVK